MIRLTAVAVKSDESRISWMIPGHQAQGFHEIGAYHGETIKRRVR
jgi:hypothetical protein